MIQTKTAKEERNLRGKCFECVSLVGLGVGKEVFQADAVEIMTFAHRSALFSIIG